MFPLVAALTRRLKLWARRGFREIKLAEYLNQRGIPGVRFVPLRFTPNASVFKDQQCGGVNIIVTDRALFRPLLTGIEMALALRKLYPNDWQVDKYLRLLVNADTLERVKRGESAKEIVDFVECGVAGVSTGARGDPALLATDERRICERIHLRTELIRKNSLAFLNSSIVITRSLIFPSANK